MLKVSRRSGENLQSFPQDAKGECFMKHRLDVCAIAVAIVFMLGMLTMTRDAVAQGRLCSVTGATA